MFMCWKTQYCKVPVLSKLVYRSDRIQASQNLSRFLCVCLCVEINSLILKFILKDLE